MTIEPKRLDQTQLALLPTEDDVAFYEEHGWYVSRKVLSDESIDQALRAVDRHYAGEGTTDLKVTDGYVQWRPGDREDSLRNDEFISLRNRAIRRFLHQPMIAAIGARLMRSQTARSFGDSLIYKPPGDGAGAAVTGWHTDGSYWSTCSSENLLTAWIPLHDVGEDRAPLTYIDRSHEWSLEDLRSFNDKDLTGFEASLRARGFGVSKVPTLVTKGQISFHHPRTVHCSEANRSDLPRISFVSHLQPDTNRYRPAVGPDGREVVLAVDRLCRALPNGDPDYADPEVFPLLWQEDGL